MSHFIVRILLSIVLFTTVQSFRCPTRRLRTPTLHPVKTRTFGADYRLLARSDDQHETNTWNTIGKVAVTGLVASLSVVAFLEVQKILQRKKQSELEEKSNPDRCPYCLGNGKILCGHCYGSKVHGDGRCECCSGLGVVTCVNCKGEGRISATVPDFSK
eukprot:gene19376-22872_t